MIVELFAGSTLSTSTNNFEKQFLLLENIIERCKTTQNVANKANHFNNFPVP